MYRWTSLLHICIIVLLVCMAFTYTRYWFTCGKDFHIYLVFVLLDKWFTNTDCCFADGQDFCRYLLLFYWVKRLILIFTVGLLMNKTFADNNCYFTEYYEFTKMQNCFTSWYEMCWVFASGFERVSQMGNNKEKKNPIRFFKSCPFFC